MEGRGTRSLMDALNSPLFELSACANFSHLLGWGVVLTMQILIRSSS
jgi:hypothetical protein